MWGNRVYLTINESSDVNEVASTLVHEIVHVLHRSECHYYRDQVEQLVDDRWGFVEEYRSFVAECIFKLGDDATPRACHKFAVEQIDAGYEFKVTIGDIVGGRGVDALAKAIFDEADDQRIVADKSRWPRSFAECR